MEGTIRKDSEAWADNQGRSQARGEVRPYAFDQAGPELDTQYAQVRREAPVARFRFPGGDVAWVVTGYEPARQVLSPHPAFSRAAALDRMPGALASKTNLMMMDPPEHTRLRRFIGGWFSARAIDGLRPRIEQVTSALLDEMAAHGADLARHLSRALPLIVIRELLGILEADRDGFDAIVDRHQATTAYRPQEIAQAKADLDRYFLQLIGTLRREPGRGLLGTRVNARDTGNAPSDAEPLDLAVVLLNARHLTTVTALTTLVFYLLTRPDDLRRISADPARLPAAIEESLRFASLGGTEDGLPWIATRDVDLGTERIRTGEAAYVAVRAANRDESIRQDGERLAFNRASAHPPIAFGYGIYGIHHCIGVPLARAELLVASTALCAVSRACGSPSRRRRSAGQKVGSSAGSRKCPSPGTLALILEPLSAVKRSITPDAFVERRHCSRLSRHLSLAARVG